MKKIVLLFVTALVLSCSSDDQVAVNSAPADVNAQKYPKTVTYHNGMWTSVFNLSYDNNHRLTQIVEQRDFSDTNNVFTMVYDDSDRMLSIEKAGEENHTILLGYDAAGRVSSWKLDAADPRPVNFEAGIYRVSVANIYSFHSYDAINDITMINDGGGICNFTYEQTNIGAFKHVVGNYQLFGLFMDSFVLTWASKKPLSGYAASAFHSYSCTNTFDEAGYVIEIDGTCGDGRETWVTIDYMK